MVLRAQNFSLGVCFANVIERANHLDILADGERAAIRDDAAVGGAAGSVTT